MNNQVIANIIHESVTESESTIINESNGKFMQQVSFRILMQKIEMVEFINQKICYLKLMVIEYRKN